MPGAIAENYKSGARHIRWYPTTAQEHLNGRVIQHPRGIGLGGSSLINGLVYLRGHPLDYDRWAANGARGWSYREVLPYFKRLESRSEGADAYRGGKGPIGVCRVEDLSPLNRAFLAAGDQAGYPFTDDVNGAEQEGFCRFDMNVDGGYRASSAYGYLEREGRPKNLEIHTRTHACRLIVKGTSVSGVEYVDSSGRHEAHALREVILSAGAIGSPQILLLSGIGPADELKAIGVPLAHHLPGVGKNLHDHLELDLQWECTRPVSLNSYAKPHLMAKIGIEWLLLKRGIAASNPFHVGAFLRSRPEVEHPDIQIHFVPACFDGWVPRAGRHGFRLSAGPMRQTSRGALTLRSADPDDLPIVNPNYLATENDRRELRESYLVIENIVSQRAFDAYRGKPLDVDSLPRGAAEIDNFVRTVADSGFHLCGTCKMGAENDASAVVDPEGRILGLKGIRVADASIMPSIVSSNLNAPTMMIAEHLSDLILGKSPLPQDVPIHPCEGRTRS